MRVILNTINFKDGSEMHRDEEFKSYVRMIVWVNLFYMCEWSSLCITVLPGGRDVSR